MVTVSYIKTNKTELGQKSGFQREYKLINLNELWQNVCSCLDMVLVGCTMRCYNVLFYNTVNYNYTNISASTGVKEGMSHQLT